jgi:hypothetical protein
MLSLRNLIDGNYDTSLHPESTINKPQNKRK